MQALLQINHKAWNKLGWIVRLSVLIICGWFIMQAFQEKWQVTFAFSSISWGIVLLVLLLGFVNWGTEVWRWKVSLGHGEDDQWSAATRQVFAGQALGWILPFTGGDLMAKLAPAESKWKIGQLIYYNRAIMLGITVIYGAFGLYQFSSAYFDSQVLLLLLALVGMSSFGWLWSKHSKSIRHTKKLICKLVLLSILRYAVFTAQFYLLIQAFHPGISTTLIIAGIGWVFLFRSIIPSLFGNLGVREASALIFFEPLISNPGSILLPCLLIWTINNVMPSVLGLYYLIRFPFKIAT